MSKKGSAFNMALENPFLVSCLQSSEGCDNDKSHWKYWQLATCNLQLTTSKKDASRVRLRGLYQVLDLLQRLNWQALETRLDSELPFPNHSCVTPVDLMV